MLGKLIKYEFKQTSGKYGMMYLVLAAYTVFALVLGMIPTQKILLRMTIGLLRNIYFIVLIAIYFCTMFYAVIRFYKTMVSEEAYLTHMLPAKVEHIVFAKFLTAYVFQLVSVAVLFFSLSTVLYQDFGNSFLSFLAGLPEVLNEAASELGGRGAVLGFVLLIILFLLVTMGYQILLYYVSIAVGQMLQGNKILGCVLGYAIINFAMQSLMTVISFLVTLFFGISAGEEALDAAFSTVRGFEVLFLFEILLVVAFSTAAFFVTKFCLQKKLNLN